MKQQKEVLLHNQLYKITNTVPDISALERSSLTQKIANELLQVLERRGR